MISFNTKKERKEMEEKQIFFPSFLTERNSYQVKTKQMITRTSDEKKKGEDESIKWDRPIDAQVSKK